MVFLILKKIIIFWYFKINVFFDQKFFALKEKKNVF